MYFCTPDRITCPPIIMGGTTSVFPSLYYLFGDSPQLFLMLKRRWRFQIENSLSTQIMDPFGERLIFKAKRSKMGANINSSEGERYQKSVSQPINNMLVCILRILKSPVNFMTYFYSGVYHLTSPMTPTRPTHFPPTH